MILCFLASSEKSVREVEMFLKMRQSSVSQQLAQLRGDQLVATRRDGKQIYYSLTSEDARRIVALLYQLFCKSCPETASRSATRRPPPQWRRCQAKSL